jgi:DNA-binding MarR family transcriptional regulator
MTRAKESLMTTLARLLEQKQELIERLQRDPGPEEREQIEQLQRDPGPEEREQIEQLLAKINRALDLLDGAGTGGSD